MYLIFTPRTKSQLHAFLGLINLDREYIQGLADLSNPLYKALYTEEKQLEWNDNLQTIFEDMKKIWSCQLKLFIPNPDIKYTLETDASSTGLGCSLRQQGKPIFHICRVLKKAELNYSITEKELLAILWGIEKLEYYLLGKQFNVITDHKALEELFNKRVFRNARIDRWMERLSRFDFNIIYRQAESHIGADALSRNIVYPGE